MKASLSKYKIISNCIRPENDINTKLSRLLGIAVHANIIFEFAFSQRSGESEIPPL